jgi:hypothetical protein
MVRKGVIAMRKLLTWLEGFFQSDLEHKVEEQYQELQTIFEENEEQKSRDSKENKMNKSIEAELRNLALKVGASKYAYDEVRGYKSASVSQLSHNIHEALQTKSMIAAVKTSTRYVAVTFVLAMIALMSMAISLISLFTYR